MGQGGWKKEQAVKLKQKYITAQNKGIMNIAQKRANEMKQNPSWLEQKMIDFLKNQNVKYDFQKIFYIYNKNGLIKQYYIADFYIPKKNLIIETDGKFHEDQKELDDERDYNIQYNNPEISMVRWKTADFNSYANMKQLVSLIK